MHERDTYRTILDTSHPASTSIVRGLARSIKRESRV